jgi:hypothetical protein
VIGAFSVWDVAEDRRARVFGELLVEFNRSLSSFRMEINTILNRTRYKIGVRSGIYDRRRNSTNKCIVLQYFLKFGFHFILVILYVGYIQAIAFSTLNVEEKRRVIECCKPTCDRQWYLTALLYFIYDVNYLFMACCQMKFSRISAWNTCSC